MPAAAPRNPGSTLPAPGEAAASAGQDALRPPATKRSTPGPSPDPVAAQQTDTPAGPADDASHDSGSLVARHRHGGVLRWWRRKRDVRRLEGRFNAYPHLLALKPRERYVFRSDYFTIDTSVACVLAFFHDDAAHDNFAAFWGIDRIPTGLDEEVTVVVLEQVHRRGEKWVEGYLKTSERIDRLDASEQAETGTASSARRAAKKSGDLAGVIAEIQDGASYLSVHDRLLLKAPDLATLEDSVERIGRLYIDRFATIKLAPYAGEQRQELTTLLAPNDTKRGKGFGFTSVELAGSHALVTNGLNDPAGEYIGHMIGDVNTSAVLFDANAYTHHVVVADNTIHDITYDTGDDTDTSRPVTEVLGRARVSDMWGSKIAQACLLNNGSVVHLVLDGADLNRLGPPLASITSRVDLNTGEVNMFEMFGEPADELAIFAAQMRKLVLMFEQVYEATDSDRSIIRGELEKTATQFYIDSGMWTRNAIEHRERLRVVGVPHEQVPRLQMFTTYLDTAHKALLNAGARDEEKLHAYGVLGVVAKNLLDNNGDLFNNHTAAVIDQVRDSRRVVYDFSTLMRRGKGVAMAQLVNIIGFAVGKLAAGDTVIIHGAENIDAGVRDYLETQLEHLHSRGGRVVYCYNDVDKMLAEVDFNRFDVADYTILGAMRDKTVLTYQDTLAQRIPPDLAGLITTRGQGLCYLRRGVSNVVFHLDLAIGINPHREAYRRRLREDATAEAGQTRGNTAPIDTAPTDATTTTSAGSRAGGTG